MLSRRFALVALLTLAAAAPAAAQEPAQRTITVGGDGSVFADNDLAVFRLGVSTRRVTAAEALRSNSFAMRRIRAAIYAGGIPPEDVETEVVSLERRRVGRRARRRTVYVASNAVAVTIRDVTRAGAIVDIGVRAGATNVFGPDFGLADAQAVYRDALGLAFSDARAKAERLAREAGLSLGPVLRIRESGIEEFDDSDRALSEGGGGDESAGTIGERPPISPGRTRVTAGVVVTFAAG